MRRGDADVRAPDQSGQGRLTRVAVQAPLGFSSGLPLLLTGGTLTTWLASEGVSVEAIGAFALVQVPYNLKFAWAPLLDRFAVPGLGRRRGWMLLAQLSLIVGLAALGATDARGSAGTLAVLAVAVAVLSATQDIVVDAFRTDVLRDGERGRGTATYVAGYRVAMIVAGFGALHLAERWGWPAVYLAMAGLMAIGAVTTLLCPEPASGAAREPRGSLMAPFVELLGRPGVGWLLAFVAVFKLGDGLVSHMIGPFLVDLGFTLGDIANVEKFLGLSMTIAGAVVGGVFVDRLGVRRGLVVFGAAQMVANAGYAVLAMTGPRMDVFVAAIGLDQLCNGLGTAAFVAFLMSACDRRYSATQYAVLTSASTLLGRLLGAGTGYAVAAVGWAGVFGVTIAVSAPALALVPRLRRAEPRAARGD